MRQLERESRPQGRTPEPADISAATKTTLAIVRQTADHIRYRWLCEAVSQSTADQWRRRAETFRAARPQPGEFHGQQTPEQIRAKWRELTALAEVCEHKATLCAVPDADTAREVLAALVEVGA